MANMWSANAIQSVAILNNRFSKIMPRRSEVTSKSKSTLTHNIGARIGIHTIHYYHHSTSQPNLEQSHFESYELGMSQSSIWWHLIYRLRQSHIQENISLINRPVQCPPNKSVSIIQFDLQKRNFYIRSRRKKRTSSIIQEFSVFIGCIVSVQLKK